MAKKKKNKVMLVSVTTDDSGKKQVSRYLTIKSSGKNKPQGTKINLKKYNRATNSHTLHTETKYK